MTKEQLDEILAGMDERERELTLAVDDAKDALMSYKLNKRYGVTVECNPGGDRTLIKIDGVVMDYEQFVKWSIGKELEELGKQMQDVSNDEEELPSEVEISYDDLEEYTTSIYGPGPSAVRKYLRKEYGYCLARGAELEFDFNDEENIVTVSNITWGRKLSESELASI